MIISDDKKFIFIHIYKTGGTSVTSMLIPYARIIEKITSYWKTRYIVSMINTVFKLGDQGNKWVNGVHKHATAIEIREYLGEDKFYDYFKFSFVRNPYDLQVSLYHYIRQSKEHRDYVIANKVSFKEFMLREIENEAPRQSDYLTDDDGKLIIDYIGKTETLEKALTDITNRLGIKIQIVEHKNKSDRKGDFMGYYDDHLKEKVYMYFKRDFDMFEYASDLFVRDRGGSVPRVVPTSA